jgi:hypothetical protein
MMAVAAMDPITTGEGSNFAVVVEKRKPSPEREIDVVPEAEEDKDEEITPAYYYENMGIPVFTPVSLFLSARFLSMFSPLCLSFCSCCDS